MCRASRKSRSGNGTETGEGTLVARKVVAGAGAGKGKAVGSRSDYRVGYGLDAVEELSNTIWLLVS